MDVEDGSGNLPVEGNPGTGVLEGEGIVYATPLDARYWTVAGRRTLEEATLALDKNLGTGVVADHAAWTRKVVD